VNSASTVLRGVSDNRHMVEILWHRRETWRQTEKTNLDLYSRKRLIYSTNAAGWPGAVSRPGLPQIRTCAINASGSSDYGFAVPNAAICRCFVEMRSKLGVLDIFPSDSSILWHPLPSTGSLGQGSPASAVL
jgi:hypothetical protein